MMFQNQRIEDLTEPPKVGESYLVSCVRRGAKYIPVLGDAHTDVELGNTLLHFHVDLRFLTDDEARSFNLDVDKYSVPDNPGESFNFSIPVVEGYSHDAVKARRFRCVRPGPNYQSPRRLQNGGTTTLEVGTLAQMGQLEDTLESQRVTKCGRCPHRGTHLGNQAVVGGVVVCPAHLMKWNKETGRLVRKTRKWHDGSYTVRLETNLK